MEHTLHATNKVWGMSYIVAAMLFLIPAFTHAGDSCLSRETMHKTKTVGGECVYASYVVQDTTVQAASASAASWNMD